MPIIIKRYRNRKLYNTRTKRYITLEEIKGLIREQEDIQVIENDTGNDITAITLSQIIFDLEKNQTGVLPVDLLFSLIQSGGKRLDEIRRNILTSFSFNRHFEDELHRRISELTASGELSGNEGEDLFTRLAAVGPRGEGLVENVEGKISGFLKDQQIPTRKDIQLLMDQVDDLSELVEQLSSANESKQGTAIKVKSSHNA